MPSGRHCTGLQAYSLRGRSEACPLVSLPVKCSLSALRQRQASTEPVRRCRLLHCCQTCNSPAPAQQTSNFSNLNILNLIFHFKYCTLPKGRFNRPQYFKQRNLQKIKTFQKFLHSGCFITFIQRNTVYHIFRRNFLYYSR